MGARGGVRYSMYIILVYIRLIDACKYLMYSVYIPESWIDTTRDYDAIVKPWSDYIVHVAFNSYDDYTRYCESWASILLTEV